MHTALIGPSKVDQSAGDGLAQALALAILAHADEAIVACDAQERIVRANQAARRLCDGNPLLRSFAEVFPLRVTASETPFLARVLGGETLQGMDAALDWHGEQRDLLLNAGPLVNAQQVVGCVVALTDVTGRRRAESALVASELSYRRLFETAKDGILILDAESGAVTDVNPFLVELLGYSRESFLGAKVWELGFFKDIVANQANFDQLQQEGYVRYDDKPLRASDGRKIDVEFVSNVYLVDHKKVIQCNIRDITARRRREEEQGRLLAIIDQSPDYIGIADLQGNLKHHNRAARTLVGLPEDADISQMTIRDMHPERAATLIEQVGIPTLLRQGTWRAENVLLHRNGTEIPVSQVMVLHRDSAGEPRFISTIMRDISDRKRAEAEKTKLEAQLQQAQKMESVGRLAGGVAHDFNNMLSVILGHTELALAQMEPADQFHADLEEIRRAAMRSADLTRQLLAFARKQTVTPKVLDLNETMAGMLKMLRRLIGENVQIQWQPMVDLWPVFLDPSQIDQILANLCVNARDAIQGAGLLTIETGNSTFDEPYCAANLGGAPGDYVRLVVSDNGCGMDKETLSHLFEPFFTTKVLSKGTGLGLATVYGIVKQNNGFINVYSEPTLGTTFKIYLPRHIGKDEKARAEGGRLPASGGPETILLVEDEPSILKLAKTLLERLGYTVLAANSPGEATALAQQHHGEIHLLMTDVVMPEMNGRVLAKRLLALYPGLKRLFMSGYTADVIAHHGVLDEGVHFIQKPFSMDDLAAKVRDALDAQD